MEYLLLWKIYEPQRGKLAWVTYKNYIVRNCNICTPGDKNKVDEMMGHVTHTYGEKRNA